MRTLESFLVRIQDTSYGSPRWTWEPPLLSMRTLSVTLSGPGNFALLWTGSFAYSNEPHCLDFVETSTKKEALQGLETKLLGAFPELGDMLYPPPPKTALRRIWDDGDPFQCHLC